MIEHNYTAKERRVIDDLRRVISTFEQEAFDSLDAANESLLNALKSLFEKYCYNVVLSSDAKKEKLYEREVICRVNDDFIAVPIAIFLTEDQAEYQTILILI